MDGETPQVPVAQKAQPESKGIPQTPQQAPIVPQTPLESTPPPSPKRN